MSALYVSRPNCPTNHILEASLHVPFTKWNHCSYQMFATKFLSRGLVYLNRLYHQRQLRANKSVT